MAAFKEMTGVGIGERNYDMRSPMQGITVTPGKETYQFGKIGT